MIDVKPLQSLKAYSPILVTELVMVMYVKKVQPENTPAPMFVTELGILIDVK